MPEFAGLSAGTLAVLKAAAWLAPEDIPLEVLPVPRRGRRRRRTTGELARIVTIADGTMTIEPALQERLRARFADEGREAAVRGMNAYVVGHSTDLTARCFRLLPHLTAWIGLTRPEDDRLGVLYMLNRVTVVLLESDLGRLAVPLIERTARSAERLLASDDPRLLMVRHHLASVHSQAGAPHRATRILEQAIEEAADTLDPDDDTLWNARANLGAHYLDLADFTKAAAVASQVVTRNRRVLGADHPDTLTARFNHACVLQRAGDTAEAISRWRSVLIDAERALGTEHAVTAMARRALSEHESGDTEPAGEVLPEPAAPIDRESIETWIEYVISVRLAGRPDVALPILYRIIDQGSAALGPGHPSVIVARSELAHAQQDSGDSAAALATLRAVLADADRILGRTHERTSITAFYLIVQLLEQNLIPEYEALLTDRLADFIDTLGFGHQIVRELAVRRAAVQLGHPSWALREGRVEKPSRKTAGSE